MTIEERNEIAMRNMGLVVTIAKTFIPQGHLDTDDYIQAGFIGLLAGISTCDNSKGNPGPYFSKCIRNAIIVEIHMGHSRPQFDGKCPEIPMGDSLDIEENIVCSGYLVANQNNGTPTIDNGMHNDIIESLIMLDDNQRRAVDLIFGLSGKTLTLREAGAVLGCSHQRVSDLKDKAVRRLRRNHEVYNRLSKYVKKRA